MTVEAWRESAACRDHPVELFFPERGVHTAQMRYVKAICAACPSAAPCLDMALVNGEQHGVWGGLTPPERTRVRNRRRNLRAVRS